MDDVAFLQQNSEPASYLALVDSANRDTRKWPRACEFEVDFDTPFNNVCGVDLLGVTVPRTECFVSPSRNVLAFSYGAPGARQAHTVALPEGDYTAVTFFAALNVCLAAFPSPAGNFLVASNTSTVQTVTSRVIFTCVEPFTVYVSRSSMRVVVGLADPVDPAYAGYTAASAADDAVASVLTPAPNSPVQTACSGLGPSAVPVVAGSPLRLAFTSAAGGIVSTVTAGLASVGVVTTGGLAWRVLSPDLQTLYASGAIQANLDAPVSSGAAAGTPLPLLAGAAYVVELADPFNADGANCYTARSVGVGVRVPVNTVAAPGLLDLTGERYLVLRCLEIEAPTNRARAFERWTAGVGIIQLGTFGYSSQAYDYSAYPPRTFPPLGSLSKLTLSFRKPDGSLYDFKGLNVQLLLLLRFYTPRTPGPSGVADPHYTPYLPLAVSQRLQEEVQWDPRYAWMPRTGARSWHARA